MRCLGSAEAEHELFECYAAATRRTAATGTITVLVSHRFSTVRMADLIVVLEHGRIRESGSHEDLMLGTTRTPSCTSFRRKPIGRLAAA
jgi:ABC-type transport system involved in Fe-S cluster assembly fused permease/ATPase subunit